MKIYKILSNSKSFNLLLFLIVLLTLILTLMLFNPEIRRSFYYNTLGAYHLYNHINIRGDIKNKNFKEVSKKIQKFIKYSQRFARGKNRSLKSIYDITELASSQINNQDQYNEMEQVYLEIDKISKDIYMNHVWLARALADNNLEKSIYHLNRALELNSSDEKIYREIIEIYHDNKNLKEIKRYCNDYFFETEGLKKNINFPNFFQSRNKFSLLIDKEDNDLNLNNLMSLNSYNTYKFNLKKLRDISNFSMIHNFFPGSKIAIKNIKLIGRTNINSLKVDNVNFYSTKSYILDQSENEIVFVMTGSLNDTIGIYLDKNYKDIKVIEFDLKVSKLPLASKSICIFK